MIALTPQVAKTLEVYQLPLFKKTACILLSGKAGVGKTTLAYILKEKFTSKGLKAEKFSFASSLKEIARLMYWNGAKDEAGRKLLQELGKTGRNYNPDTWCKILFEDVIPRDYNYPYDVIMIDDWRFKNEYTFVNNYIGYHTFSVRIVAPNREVLKGMPEYNDVSETELDNLNLQVDFNCVINNEKEGLDILKGKSLEIINMVLKETPQM